MRYSLAHETRVQLHQLRTLAHHGAPGHGRAKPLLYLPTVRRHPGRGVRHCRAGGGRAVLRLLEDEEWARWSDREIARQCCVSAMTVGRIRQELISNNVIDGQKERTVQRNGTTYTMATANIGNGAVSAPVWERVQRWRQTHSGRQLGMWE